MKNKARFLFTTACGLVVFIMIFSTVGYHKSFASSNEIDIETLPTDILFDVDNMKPGDWATRTYTIQNKGTQDMDYYLSAQFKSGSEKLYKALMLQVKDGEKSLYSGSLAGFTDLEKRPLTVNDQEELTFTVDFPAELGNEFQGLISDFAIIVSAEGSPPVGTSPNTGSDSSSGEPDGTTPSGGKNLPDTATHMFNLLIAGTALFLAGAAIYLYSRRSRKGIKIS
ncbi:TasA family protein [Sediminibacillus halophilus]|uniref:LPXTG-motif cell wall anchor domain-containing protein n=1 Tax=Sediminibacillus halophilus TaxID=482461 RepID=A0A1G9VBP6_9BACI|nr:TasA family protein [Sediminibacillus halophilus]SDM69589.1 LPXTG-motif cell wall anchor domain-containing protein [Sediminibacillus halophilus]